MNDNVNHPSHYTNSSIECIEAIRASLSTEQYIGYLKGQVMKYNWRSDHKGKRLEDTEKSGWYQKELIRFMKEVVTENGMTTEAEEKLLKEIEESKNEPARGAKEKCDCPKNDCATCTSLCRCSCHEQEEPKYSRCSKCENTLMPCMECYEKNKPSYKPQNTDCLEKPFWERNRLGSDDSNLLVYTTKDGEGIGGCNATPCPIGGADATPHYSQNESIEDTMYKSDFKCGNCGHPKTDLQKQFDQKCKNCGLRDWDIEKHQNTGCSHDMLYSLSVNDRKGYECRRCFELFYEPQQANHSGCQDKTDCSQCETCKAQELHDYITDDKPKPGSQGKKQGCLSETHTVDGTPDMSYVTESPFRKQEDPECHEEDKSGKIRRIEFCPTCNSIYAGKPFFEPSDAEKEFRTDLLEVLEENICNRPLFDRAAGRLKELRKKYL